MTKEHELMERIAVDLDAKAELINREKGTDNG